MSFDILPSNYLIKNIEEKCFNHFKVNFSILKVSSLTFVFKLMLLGMIFIYIGYIVWTKINCCFLTTYRATTSRPVFPLSSSNLTSFQSDAGKFSSANNSIDPIYFVTLLNWLYEVKPWCYTVTRTEKGSKPLF